MSELAKTVGQRIRNYRIQKGLSQEKLAEFSSCHPTYIGQLERGERTPLLKALNALLQRCRSHSLPFLKRLITITMVPEIFLWNAMI